MVPVSQTTQKLCIIPLLPAMFHMYCISALALSMLNKTKTVALRAFQCVLVEELLKIDMSHLGKCGTAHTQAIL